MGRPADTLLDPSHGGRRMTNGYERDADVIAGLQKLRFFPQSIVGGQGATLRSDDGRTLIDLSASWGAASLGYGHPAVVAAVCAAITDPAGASVLSSASAPATALAKRLIALFPDEQPQKVWFGHSGSDANETAVRAARKATGRQGIISFVGAYHGCTLGTMAVSGHSALGGDKAPGLIQLPFPAEGQTIGPTAAEVLVLLERRLAKVGPDTVAACLFEPIQSDGGLIVPPAGFLAGLDALCRRHGILTICDEVKVGLGRTGRMHAFEHEGFRPDILVLGKGLGGGLPLSAVIGPAWVMDCATAFAMQTLHGNPVCAAAGLAVLDVICATNLAAEAARKGAWLQARLRDLSKRHRIIGEVRGRGLAIGVEIVAVQDHRSPDRHTAANLVFRAHEQGLVLYYVGMDSNVLELTPPLTITEIELDQALGLLDQALTDLANGKIAPDTAARFTGW